MYVGFLSQQEANRTIVYRSTEHHNIQCIAHITVRMKSVPSPAISVPVVHLHLNAPVGGTEEGRGGEEEKPIKNPISTNDLQSLCLKSWQLVRGRL